MVKRRGCGSRVCEAAFVRGFRSLWVFVFLGVLFGGFLFVGARGRRDARRDRGTRGGGVVCLFFREESEDARVGFFFRERETRAADGEVGRSPCRRGGDAETGGGNLGP